jgi:hypothetical protein
VKPQRGQFWNRAALQGLERILLYFIRHDDPKPGDVLAEDFYRRLLHPSFTKTDALGIAARHTTAGASVHRLLKDCYSRFVPEAMVHQDGRVRRCGKNWCGDQLGSVVKPHESRGGNLEVHLKAGATGLQHDAVVGELEFV